MTQEEDVAAGPFYDAIAAGYDAEMARRDRYIAAIDDVVVASSQRSAASTILDIGCGNGRRLARLTERTGCRGVGIDVSEAMVSEAKRIGVDARILDVTAAWDERARRVLPLPRYDLVTSLWNVFAHLGGSSRRRRALDNIRSVLGVGGLFVFDVNNRHNASAYGWARALRNIVADAVPRERRGDFVVRREAGDRMLVTRLHLFTVREVSRLCRDAALEPRDVHFIDYETGQPAGRFGGQICIVAEAR